MRARPSYDGATTTADGGVGRVAAPPTHGGATTTADGESALRGRTS